MSDEFLTDPGTNADGSALRKFAEAQKSRADLIEQRFNELQKQVTASTVKSAFDQLGVPDAIRRFYDGEADPAKVKAWVDENKAVFNFQPQAGATNTAGTSVSPEAQAQQQAAQDAAGFGQEPGQSQELDAFKQKAAAVRNTSAQRNPQALNELLAGLIPQGGYTPPQVI